MPYVIRPTDDQKADIARLMDATGQRTASKALLIAARDYPALVARVAELEAEAAQNDLATIRRDIARLAAVRPVAVQAEAAPAPAASISFAETAADYLDTRDDLAAAVIQNWRTTLGYATFADLDVASVTVEDVKATLAPLWTDKPSVGRKLKARVGNVFQFAIAKGLRVDDPSANVTALLPKAKVQRRNHASVTHDALGAVLRAVDATQANRHVKLALRFTALTGCRSGEVRGAKWGEFDLDARTWTIPADRMKAKREHVVPLSDQAVALVQEARTPGETWLFPSETGLQIASAILSRLTKNHGTTIHGFRTAFKGWAIENRLRREAVEACLAHTIGLTNVEQAYIQADLLQERAAIMQAWADYLDA